MAKRKTKPRAGGRRKRQAVPFLSWAKRLAVSVVAAVAVMVGTLFLYDHFYPGFDRREASETSASGKRSSGYEAWRRQVTEKQAREAAGKTERKKTRPAAAAPSAAFTRNVELPRLTVKRAEQVIRHEGYTVSYNSDYRIANWVAYELTAEEVALKQATRSNKFVPDPAVKGATATNEDYTRTGYDRGHLAPAGDMRWSLKAMRESFYLSNICPQKPGLNRGIWKDLEEQCRLWAKENGALLVTCGPVIRPQMRRMGKNGVGVPDRFYKVLCTIVDGNYEGVAFLFDNRDYGKTTLPSLMLPIDRVERETGIDFFPDLPDSIEARMEAKVNAAAWSF